MRPLKFALKYGALAGFLMPLGWWLTQVIFPPVEGEPYDFSQGEYFGYAAMLLALTAVFIGIKQYRDKQKSGVIRFWEAFRLGLYIVLVASAIYVISWLIYMPNFMPDFADQYTEFQVKQYEESGLTGAELETKKQELYDWMELYENPAVMIGMTFMEIFPVGLVVTLISAAILRKKQ